MSKQTASRNLPVAVVGAVNILAPTGSSPYFRLTWTDPDGKPGRTTGGRTLQGATEKAGEINAMLVRAAGPSGAMVLSDLIEEYVSTGVGRKQGPEGGDWTGNHRKQVRRHLNRAAFGYKEVLCWDVDRRLLDLMRAQAGTPRTVRENTKALRGLLRWGHLEGVFSAEQADLLPERCPTVKPSRKGTVAPVRRRKGRRVEETVEYIRDEDAPNAFQVVRIGEELASAFPKWGRLAPECAAGCGLRWGEQFQLTAYDVFVEESDYTRAGRKRPFIAVDWQVDQSAKKSAGDSRRKLPKGEKTRTVGIPAVSFTGYRLLEALRLRRAQALAEQAAGTNPEALMFPSKTGKILHHTAFNTDYLVPAARRCTYEEWPTRIWTETYDRFDRETNTYSPATRHRTQMVLTWHSLRHRFARTCVDVLGMKAGELMAMGGWENETVVKNRYYESGEEHVESGLDCFSKMDG